MKDPFHFKLYILNIWYKIIIALRGFDAKRICEENIPTNFRDKKSENTF